MKKPFYILFVSALLVGCAKLPPKPILTQNQLANDRVPMSMPAETTDLKYGEIVDLNLFGRLAPVVDVRNYGKLIGNSLGADFGREADNANLFDEVADSTWFTNRHARRQLSLKVLKEGPTKVRLASTGPLTVVSGKSSGVTPGFVVKDANGNMFVLKLDPASACGLPSSADVIGSRIFHAAGYYVPENNIEYIDPKRFVRGSKAKTKNAFNEKIPLREERFREMVDGIPRSCGKDGKVRILASRFLSGIPVGPFQYRGRRRDDVNDKIRHQHRRELRGMTVLASWVHHTDLRNYNTLDMFQKTDGDKGHIIHHFIDFGATLGSGSTGPKLPFSGREHWIDYQSVGLNLVSLGFRDPDYLKKKPIKYASVGNFRIGHLIPAKWRPTQPHPGIEARTKRDGFWGAKLVASFTDEDLKAIVEAGDLPEEGAAEELVRILAGRRDLIASYWFSQAGALDRFAVENAEIPLVLFMDWQRKGSWDPGDKISYHWTLRSAGRVSRGKTDTTKIQLFDESAEWDSWKKELQKKKYRYLRLRITPYRKSVWEKPAHKPEIKEEKAGHWTEATFYLDEAGRLHWVGVKRGT